jgi:hypothetical protein
LHPAGSVSCIGSTIELKKANETMGQEIQTETHLFDQGIQVQPCFNEKETQYESKESKLAIHELDPLDIVPMKESPPPVTCENKIRYRELQELLVLNTTTLIKNADMPLIEKSDYEMNAMPQCLKKPKTFKNALKSQNTQTKVDVIDGCSQMTFECLEKEVQTERRKPMLSLPDFDRDDPELSYLHLQYQYLVKELFIVEELLK